MTPGGWTELWHGTLAFTSAATDNGPNSWGTNVLIATFNARTGWAGKTVWLENEQFTLEGHGPISAADVLLYDRQGYLEWAHAGLQEWVAAAASSAPAPWAANETAEAKARGGAASRPARDPVVDVKRVSRGDWVVGGGFLALLVGTSLPWYTWSGSYLGAEFHFVDTGWTSAAGVLSFLTVLAAVVLVILASGVLPSAAHRLSRTSTCHRHRPRGAGAGYRPDPSCRRAWIQQRLRSRHLLVAARRSGCCRRRLSQAGGADSRGRPFKGVSRCR